MSKISENQIFICESAYLQHHSLKTERDATKYL